MRGPSRLFSIYRYDQVTQAYVLLFPFEHRSRTYCMGVLDALDAFNPHPGYMMVSDAHNEVIATRAPRGIVTVCEPTPKTNS